MSRQRAPHHSRAHQRAAHGLGGAVGAGADQGGGAGGGDGDQAGEERGPFRAEPLHAHVPAHEADDGDHDRLPQQRGALRRVRRPQPRAAVGQESRRGRLRGGEPAHGGGQQPRPQRPQHGHREHREADLSTQRTDGIGESGAVGPPPPLHHTGPHRDEPGPQQDRAPRPPSLRQGDQDRHDDRRAAHQDPGHGGFGRALGGQDRHIEADHPDRRQQPEPPPLTGRERAHPAQGAGSGQRDEEQTGEAVPEELATRVRIVAEHAVGGEGGADEDAGERGEQGAARGGGVHENDVRKSGGPV